MDAITMSILLAFFLDSNAHLHNSFSCSPKITTILSSCRLIHCSSSAGLHVSRRVKYLQHHMLAGRVEGRVNVILFTSVIQNYM